MGQPNSDQKTQIRILAVITITELKEVKKSVFVFFFTKKKYRTKSKLQYCTSCK